MTVSDHVASFGFGAAVGAAVGAVGAAVGGAVGAAAVGGGVGVAAAVGGAVAAGGADFKPRSAIAGALTSVAAIAFTAWHFEGQPAALPAAPVAGAPATTLIAEGKCKDIQTRFTGKDGTRVELILPPGCTLNPAP